VFDRLLGLMKDGLGFGMLMNRPKLLQTSTRLLLFVIIIYYSWNGGRAEAVCARENE
jgi:hypothetical protein